MTETQFVNRDGRWKIIGIDRRRGRGVWELISRNHSNVAHNGINDTHYKTTKFMNRDVLIMFLLLISDREKLHRDSRRDTEQNVPCSRDINHHVTHDVSRDRSHHES